MPTHPTEAYRLFIGNGAAKLVERALPPGKKDKAFAADCLEAFHREYDGGWNRKTRLYDGVAEMLDALSTLDIDMAIFTNKPHQFAELCIKEYFSAWSFSVVLGQMDGVPIKPDPTVPLDIAGRFGLPPEDMLYLGDSGVDMKTAVAAGMLPVGALWGFRSERELREAGATELIARPADLLRFFNWSSR